jgi:aminotransferase
MRVMGQRAKLSTEQLVSSAGDALLQPELCLPVSQAYRQCSRCIMDTTDPEIEFDARGFCNHCRAVDEIRKRWNPEGDPRAVERLIDRIKTDGKGREYDIILGISGGVDSSYLALLARDWGLRALLIHVDTGWNSELAVHNIENIVTKLNFDLETHVVDWEEMQDLQYAFLRSGVPNQDVPQDHAIFAAFYGFAAKHRMRWAFSGHNYACESILPRAWGYDPMDKTHLIDVHRRFGRRPLIKYPTISHFRLKFQQFWYGMRIARPLNLICYRKNVALERLAREVGWRNYGAKHYESRFTKFFQGWYLPKKWGYDKSLAHLSSLVMSDQITRDDALAEYKNGRMLDYEVEDVMDYMRNKLDLDEQGFSALLNTRKVPHEAFRQLPKWQRQLGAYVVNKCRRALLAGT